MSDFTANRIIIRGSQGELAYARHVLHDMDFDKIVPCPETLLIDMTNTDAGHPFGQENRDLSYLWGEDSEDRKDSRRPKSCFPLQALRSYGLSLSRVEGVTVDTL